MLVDIRPAAQRAAEGEIPGALIVERNVLEWRFDPASAARLPQASYDLQVIVFCSEGYTSSLAAAALQDLGIRGRPTWTAASWPGRRPGLPVASRSQQRELNRGRARGRPSWAWLRGLGCAGSEPAVARLGRRTRRGRGGRAGLAWPTP